MHLIINLWINHYRCGENVSVPDWFMCLMSFSHFSLICSSSVNFFIYSSFKDRYTSQGGGLRNKNYVFLHFPLMKKRTFLFEKHTTRVLKNYKAYKLSLVFSHFCLCLKNNTCCFLVISVTGELNKQDPTVSILNRLVYYLQFVKSNGCLHRMIFATGVTAVIITNHNTVYAFLAPVGERGREREPFVYILAQRPYTICLFSLKKIILSLEFLVKAKSNLSQNWEFYFA